MEEARWVVVWSVVERRRSLRWWKAVWRDALDKGKEEEGGSPGVVKSTKSSD